jgi:hypothetical protein
MEAITLVGYTIQMKIVMMGKKLAMTIYYM